MSLVTPPSLTRRRGLTLTEVLIAMGIFTVGFVAVASLVPAAIFLQRETVNQTNSDAYTQSIESLVNVIGFNGDALNNLGGFSQDTIDDFEVSRDRDALGEWSLADRSYPSTEPVELRTQFFVPLFMDTADDPTGFDSTTRSWRIYIFVTRAEVNTVPSGRGDPNDTLYPNDPRLYPRGPAPIPNSETGIQWANPHATDQWGGSTNIAITPGIAQISVGTSGGNLFTFDNFPRLIRPGDKILSSNDNSGGNNGAGVIYSVTDADDTSITISGTIIGDPSEIWFAHPGRSDRSTFVDLFILVDNNGDLVFTPTP